MRVKRILISMVAVIAAIAMTSDVFATALSASRNTPSRTGAKIQLTIASNVVIYAGSLVCVDSSGLANPAADTSGFAVIGMAEQTVDNRTAVYVATKKIAVSRGVFRWANADVIAAADIGKIVYVTDDATVNKTGGGQNIIAGSVVDVDDDGVWVDTAKVGPSGAATPSSLSVSGVSTFTGVATFTAESVHNGGIDADYITTDAAAGIDSKTAGTLVVGASTATKVEIADTAVETEIQGTLDQQEAATFATTVEVTGLTTLTGGATVGAAGKVTTTPVAAANATNGQAVTLSGVINLINATGSAANGTNTVTLANASAAGVWAVIVNVDTATNLLAVAKTGNYYGPALELAPGESAILWAQSTSKWHGIGE